MKTVEENWQEFKTAVYPRSDMMPEQARQVRAAFMAGSARMLQAMDDVSKLPDDDALKALEALNIEMGEIAGGIIEETARVNARRQ